eukprot:Sdes_comp13043_c0_seq2m3044
MAASDPKANLSENEIISRFNQLREEQKSLASKISELENEKHEHGLVIDAIKDLEGDRKCFRLVGGVLVERTVREVLPALKTNQNGISEITKQLQEQLVNKGKEINSMKEKFNIRIRGEEESSTKNKETPTKSTGVLV